MDPEELKALIDATIKKSVESKPEITASDLQKLVQTEVGKAFEEQGEGGVATTALTEEQKELVSAEVTKQVAAVISEMEHDRKLEKMIEKALAKFNTPEPDGDLTPVQKAAQRIAPIGGRGPAIIKSSSTPSGRRYGPVPDDEFSMVRLIKALGDKNQDEIDKEIEKDYLGMDADVIKAMSTENLEEGGITVPSPTANRMIDVLRARMVTDKAGVTHVPMPEATLTIPVMSQDVGAFWGVADNEDLPEGQQLKFEGRALILKDLTVLIPVPNKLLDDSSFDMERMLRTSITKKVGLAADIARLRGTGSNMPIGLQNYTGVTEVTGVTAVNWDLEAARNFVNQTELNESELTAFVMHPTLLHRLQGEKDANGKPIYNVDPAIPQRKTLFGFPVHTTTNCKDVSTATDLLVFGGDWEEVLIGSKGGLKIDADKSIGFKQNVTWIRAMLREDLVIEHPEVMVRQTIDNN